MPPAAWTFLQSDQTGGRIHFNATGDRRKPQCNQTLNAARAVHRKSARFSGRPPNRSSDRWATSRPQLATYVLETIYGEIYQSPVLDSRTRQIVTVAALATLGTAAPQLRTHIGGALRCGVTREELVEIMMQLVPYVGVAAAINGVAACREVFAAADKG